MSRRFALSVVGLALLAGCAALIVMPARWILAILPAGLPLAVVDAGGTVWSGNATIAVGTSQHRRTIPDPLHWQLSFASGPRVLVSHPWLGGTLTLVPRWLGLGISAQTLQLPASVLATLDARIAAIQPDGELSFKWPATFIGGDSRPAGAPLLDVHWRNAASALTPVRPLGDYALALKHTAPGAAQLTLGTRQGPLMLKGSGTLDHEGGFRFDGTANADPAASTEIQAALRDVLAALGPQHNNQTLLRFR